MAKLTAFTCAPDCKAEVVYWEENRPLVCWNCGRTWTLQKDGTLAQASAATKVFTVVAGAVQGKG